MKTTTLKITLFSLITAGLVAVPVWIHAQDAGTNAPASSDMTPAPAKHKHGQPFHGTLDGVDTNAMTITVGSRTFQMTSKTKITKNGAPSVLADGVVGQPVSGYYRTDADGTTLDAVTVHFGPHGKKHHKATADTGMTNAPSMTTTNAAN